MMILGIETSCDETAAAVLEINNGRFKIHANIVSSSVKLQAKYGGIVPEIAARKQMEYIIPVVKTAIGDKKIDYIAVTSGPGLISSLRVGVEAAKTLSYILKKPLISVNHMEGHIYAVELGDFSSNANGFNSLNKIKFPALALLVSGGHTELVLISNYLKYKIIGETRDDAVGEAFDKVARILKLGYPGGPAVARQSALGDKTAVKFPRPMLSSGDFDFSFSGLKTAVLYESKSRDKLSAKDKRDICASFENACVDVLVNKTLKAAEKLKVKSICLGGGVSANKLLRNELAVRIKHQFPKIELLMPNISLTGDNALMIAMAGYYKIKKRRFIKWDNLKTEANLRLSLKIKG